MRNSGRAGINTYYPFRDTASCLFGSALDELKEQYPEDVVIAATAEWKLILAFALEDPKTQYRPACSALFEPYKA